MSSLRTQRWECDVCKVAQFTDYDEACRHETMCKQSQEEHQQKSTHSFFAPMPKISSGNTASTQQQKQMAVITIDDDDDDDDADSPKKRKVSPLSADENEEKILDKSNKNKKKKQKSASNSKATPLASIFAQGKAQKDLLAEQHVVEFAAQRRLAQERERILREKRAVRTVPAGTFKAVPHPSRLLRDMAIYYPKPSHVIGGNATSNVEASHPQGSTFAKARRYLTHSTKHASGAEIMDMAPPKDSTPLRAIVPASPAAGDPLEALLSSILVPPTCSDEDSAIWTDKFAPQQLNDFCDSQQAIAENCLAFVQDYKLLRQRAHERRAERQQRLQGKRRKRKTTAQDDLWGDDDDNIASPIVLVEGPTGCGKSALVHALAKLADCPIIEVNTTSARSSTALRQLLEQVTQSDLLQQNQASILQQEEETLSDSDEEESGSTIPIVLIDEVDLMFEEDAGFWSVLKSVAKKAQCPIFLTANLCPKEIGSIPQFTHFVMEKPTDCFKILWKVIKTQGMGKKDGVDRMRVQTVIEEFAEHCEGDLRRMINTLQLFALANQSRTVSSLDTQPTFANTAGPSMISIEPRIVPSTDSTLLTIRGEHFEKLLGRVIVQVGGQPCLAVRVVDAKTLYAVCPPCKVPSGVNRYGELEASGKDCLACRYPFVTIRLAGEAVKRVCNVQLCHQSRSACIMPCTLEYSFPSRKSDKEEGVFENLLEHLGDAEEQATKLLNEALPAANDTTVGPIENSSATGKKCDESTRELLQIANSLQLESDLEHLRWSLQCAAPRLAGPSLGFGSTLVHDIIASPDPGMLSLTANVKPPSFDRLFNNGWNECCCFYGDCDAYMTNPNALDRRLLYETALRSRQLFFSPSSTITAEKGEGNGAEENDIHFKMFASIPEEDAFLIRGAGAYSDLPDVMRHFCTEATPRQVLQDNLLSCRRQTNAIKMNTTLWNLLPRGSMCNLFDRGLDNTVCAPTDSPVMLDYIPMLASICLFENSFQSTMEGPDEQQASRRSTRRSRVNQQSQHYCFGWKNVGLFSEDYRELGEAMARNWLEYENY